MPNTAYRAPNISTTLTMDFCIKILILEHDVYDLELMQYEIKKSGLQYVSQIVQTKESYHHALCTFKPDIILSDFSLPSFDGLSAFYTRQETAPDTPFIIVSGTIGEEKAVELIKMGVTDYILKEKMYQITPKVLRALKEAEERRIRELAEKKLQYKEEQLQRIIDQSLDVICTADAEGRFIQVGAASASVWGYAPEELVGRKGIELVYEADVVSTRAAGSEIRKGTAMTNFENRFVRKDGALVSMSWSIRWDASDSLMYCIARDATEAKKAAKELADQNQYMLNIFESMTTGFCAIDRNWIARYWNKEAEEILGMERSQVVNKNFWEVFAEALPLKFYTEYHRAMEEGLASSFEEYLPSADIWFDVKVDPSKDGISIFFRDISDRKEAEARQLKMTEELYRQNKDLQQFTYIVSHNLRAPVANALGLTSLLLKTEKGTPVYDQSLAHLKTSVSHLDTVLRDMNMILSIRDRQEVFDKEQVRLADVLREAFLHLEEPLLRCGGQFTIDVPEGLSVRASRAYLYSIFHNLLSNAIKYRSEARALQVHVKCGEGPEGGKLISFADNGSGFDLKKAGPNVFKLYKRFHTNKEGRGIGLHLVKTHVESLGGHIEVHSQVNVGTTFFIQLN
jgi:PAS domain S-box-containing protein